MKKNNAATRTLWCDVRPGLSGAKGYRNGEDARDESTTAPALPNEARVKMALPSGSLRGHLDAFRLAESSLACSGIHLLYDADRPMENWRQYLSANDTKRTEDILDGLRHPAYDMIWFGRGGSGCGRVVEPLYDYAMDLDTPQLLMGFQTLPPCCYHLRSAVDG